MLGGCPVITNVNGHHFLLQYISYVENSARGLLTALNLMTIITQFSFDETCFFNFFLIINVAHKQCTNSAHWRHYCCLIAIDIAYKKP
jgi:hypothetical protein